MDWAIRQPPPSILISGMCFGEQSKLFLIPLGYAISANGNPLQVPEAGVKCDLRLQGQQKTLMDELTQLDRQLLDGGLEKDSSPLVHK